ncbi:MAG: tautomerase family protein [Candidatus Helarchaeota archaeon]
MALNFYLRQCIILKCPSLSKKTSSVKKHLYGVGILPLVQVYLWEGFKEEGVKKVIKEITDVFVNMGIPQQAVEVIVQIIPKSHWGIDGKPATESRPDARPPQ